MANGTQVEKDESLKNTCQWMLWKLDMGVVKLNWTTDTELHPFNNPLLNSRVIVPSQTNKGVRRKGRADGATGQIGKEPISVDVRATLLT
jgi:hypothetical protein